jgi:hypothetical protein
MCISDRITPAQRPGDGALADDLHQLRDRAFVLSLDVYRLARTAAPPVENVIRRDLLPLGSRSAGYDLDPAQGASGGATLAPAWGDVSSKRLTREQPCPCGLPYLPTGHEALPTTRGGLQTQSAPHC